MSCSIKAFFLCFSVAEVDISRSLDSVLVALLMQLDMGRQVNNVAPDFRSNYNRSLYALLQSAIYSWKLKLIANPIELAPALFIHPLVLLITQSKVKLSMRSFVSAILMFFPIITLEECTYFYANPGQDQYNIHLNRITSSYPSNNCCTRFVILYRSPNLLIRQLLCDTRERTDNNSQPTIVHIIFSYYFFICRALYALIWGQWNPVLDRLLLSRCTCYRFLGTWIVDFRKGFSRLVDSISLFEIICFIFL